MNEPTPRAAALLAIALLAACGSDATDTHDPTFDVAAIDAATVPARVVDACHAEVTGFDRFAAQVTLPDGSKAKAFGSLPTRLRIEWPDQRVELVDGAVAKTAAREGAPSRSLTDDEAARAFAMLRLLDTATLGPLRRASACERTGASSFRVTTRDGATFSLALEQGALRVASLQQITPTGLPTVVVIEHLRTSTTRIVRVADTAPLGACTIRFDAVDFAWDESMFAERATDKPAATETPAPSVTVGSPQRPTEPTIESARPARWLCVDDPGTWEARAAFAQRAAAALRAEGQKTAGFCGLADDGGRALFVVPFRAGPGAAAFGAFEGATIREAPAVRSLAVYPPRGSFDERARQGAAQIQKALADRGLQAAGPVLTQPFVHLDEKTPDADALASPVVRVSVALR